MLGLGDRLAKDVDALRFEALEVRKRGHGRSAGFYEKCGQDDRFLILAIADDRINNSALITFAPDVSTDLPDDIQSGASSSIP
jgi:hypothetical protein